MSDVGERHLLELCDFFEPDAKNSLHRNWKYIAEQLDWKSKDIDAGGRY